MIAFEVAAGCCALALAVPWLLRVDAAMMVWGERTCQKAGSRIPR